MTSPLDEIEQALREFSIWLDMPMHKKACDKALAHIQKFRDDVPDDLTDAISHDYISKAKLYELERVIQKNYQAAKTLSDFVGGRDE